MIEDAPTETSDPASEELDLWFAKSTKENKKATQFKKWNDSLGSSFKTTASISQRTKRYFEEHVSVYPTIKRVSDIVNTLPGSSGSIERLFSKANDLLSSKRNNLDISTVENLLQTDSYNNVRQFFE